MQHDIKCILCEVRDETVYHIMRKCSKVAQREYETAFLGWKVDPLGIAQERDHITKWYMHKPESVLEDETHKILLGFEIQTIPVTPVRRPRPCVNQH